MSRVASKLILGILFELVESFSDLLPLHEAVLTICCLFLDRFAQAIGWCLSDSKSLIAFEKRPVGTEGSLFTHFWVNCLF